MTPGPAAGSCLRASLSFGIDDDERRSDRDRRQGPERERPAGNDAGHGVKCGVKLGM